jgi:hypothetical protein
LPTKANELLRACLAAAREGADFHAVWRSVLKGHEFVAGLPVQALLGELPVLHVPLLSGIAIVVGPGQGDYRLSTEPALP